VQIELGHLPQISRIVARAEHGGASGDWPLEKDFSTPRPLWHALEGQTVSIPYFGAATQTGDKYFSLLEQRHGGFQVDVTSTHLVVSAEHKSVQLTRLPRGTYSLLLKEFGTALTVVVAKGELVMESYVQEPTRFVELRARDVASLQVVSVQPSEGGAALDIQLTQYTPNTRVHVFSSHFVPEYSIVSQLQR
jgi:hypothetical protein